MRVLILVLFLTGCATPADDPMSDGTARDISRYLKDKYK